MLNEFIWNIRASKFELERLFLVLEIRVVTVGTSTWRVNNLFVKDFRLHNISFLHLAQISTHRRLCLIIFAWSFIVPWNEIYETLASFGWFLCYLSFRRFLRTNFFITYRSRLFLKYTRSRLHISFEFFLIFFIFLTFTQFIAIWKRMLFYVWFSQRFKLQLVEWLVSISPYHSSSFWFLFGLLVSLEFVIFSNDNFLTFFFLRIVVWFNHSVCTCRIGLDWPIKFAS